MNVIKNQILKHLTRFFKDLAPEQLQLSAFKGSCELSNLQLEEKVLMELLSFPAWMRINKAACDQLSIKIPWTKIKSVPIHMSLNEVTVEIECCEEFRDISNEEELNLANLINTQAPSKYGFVDRVIDGITVSVNSVLIEFKSKLMSASFNLSRVVLESRCPNWKPGELSLTRIKDTKRGQILLFKVVDWQTMRLGAKCLTDPDQAPLRLITNHAQCRITIKKKLDDCSVVAARIFVIFEDILWVLTFAQFVSAASFVEYVFSLIKRSPMRKKEGLIDAHNPMTSARSTSTSNISTTSSLSSSFSTAQSTASLVSPLNTPSHTASNQSAPLILTGNLSAASLAEQKFLFYDILETSLHLFVDKVDTHLYDDTEASPSSGESSESGGSLQTTLDQVQVDCYPYSQANGVRTHWYKWFDPSPTSRKQWLNSHFFEFDLARQQKSSNLDQDSLYQSEAMSSSIHCNPTASDDQLLSLTVLVKIKDYCMNCVATRNSICGVDLDKFIETDKDYHMPSEMPALYFELNYFYYFDAINRLMVYENVPNPLAFMHLSPTKLLFDSPTLLFLNSFHVNLSKAFLHIHHLFPEQAASPKIHCQVEILMPQLILPARSGSDQTASSSLLIKSGKITLCSALYNKEILSKLVQTIEKLRENPTEPINFACVESYANPESTQNNQSESEADTTEELWNLSMINDATKFPTPGEQLWAVQFDSVWLDFMNFDVREPNSGHRLEPIVDPVSAYAFIHLNLASLFKNETVPLTDVSASKLESVRKRSMRKRDIISILFSVVEEPIHAKMDKVQFSFLKRLGLHVDKLLRKIKEDASKMIQLETNSDNMLEVNLTAFIEAIRLRLMVAIEPSDTPEIDSRFKENSFGLDLKNSQVCLRYMAR